MKKIMYIVLLGILFIPFSVFASNNVVNFSVLFDEDVDSSTIENIYVYYTDKSEAEYSITLKRENNFQYSYDAYDGSNIERVKTTFDVSNIKGEANIVKNDVGYNIYINVSSSTNSGDIYIDTTPTTTTTKVAEVQTTTGVSITSGTTTTTTVNANTINSVSTKSDKIVRKVFLVISCILGMFVFSFLIYATIKIVNANK